MCAISPSVGVVELSSSPSKVRQPLVTPLGACSRMALVTCSFRLTSTLCSSEVTDLNASHAMETPSHATSSKRAVLSFSSKTCPSKRLGDSVRQHLATSEPSE